MPCHSGRAGFLLLIIAPMEHRRARYLEFLPSVCAAACLTLGACAQTSEVAAIAPPPPPPPGAVAGTIAADRNGDGIVDGYYTADGVYHANYVPPPPAPMPMPTRKGERG